MKKMFAILQLLLSGLAQAQPSLYDSVNQKRYQIGKSGFTVLGTLGVINIGAGLIGQKQTKGVQQQFYRATAISGAVDLVFAGIGYITTRRMAGKPHTPAETFRKQAAAEKVFLFSVGLDLAAAGYGLYTRERANRFTGDKRDRLQGAGEALILQSAFLTVFDGVMYLLQAKNGSRLRPKLENLSVGAGQNGAGLVYRF